MRWAIILFFVSLSAFAGTSKPIKNKAPDLVMDAHEVRGVDRKELSISIDSEPIADSELRTMETGEVVWTGKMKETAEDLSQW